MSTENKNLSTQPVQKKEPAFPAPQPSPSNPQKLRIRQAILVEGKYDKIKLSQLVDTAIFTTGGFSVFSAGEKCALLRRIAEKQGLIVLTDSDPAGFVIRNKLKGMLPRDKVLHLYASAVAGKEARKRAPSKAGLLGIEGLSANDLRRLFERSGVVVAEDAELSQTENGMMREKTVRTRKTYTKADLYAAGLCGGADSAAKRDAFCRENDLPCGMTPNALLEAVNLLALSLPEESNAADAENPKRI